MKNMETLTVSPDKNNTIHRGMHNGHARNSGDFNSNYNNYYRDKYVINAESLEMGVYLQQDTFVSEMKHTQRVTFVINYDRRRIKIEFGVIKNNLLYDFKLEIDFKNIDGEIYSEQQGYHRSITIASKYPARYWINDSEKKTWKRMTKIFTRKNVGPLQTHMPDNSEQLGKWVVFRVTFDLDTVGRNFREMMMKAQEYNILSRSISNKPLKVVDGTDLRKYVDNSMLDFDVLHMTECNLSFNYLNYYNLNEEFFTLLSQQPVQSALKILGNMYEAKKRIFDPLSYLQLEINKLNEINYKKTKPNHVPHFCVMMRKVVVTPTTMYVLPPTMETGNRVIRYFRKKKENFLRVEFVDEGTSKIGSSHGNFNETTNDALYNRIFYTLSNGIKIGDKHYEFLAFSASQLREHSCWFFASTDELTADNIRDWMGNFSSNKSVAKYAARMGQCFSSTRAIQYLKVNDIVLIPDVERNGYTFSDGIGKISTSLARTIAEKLEWKTIPSAFQFRLAGCKGMLCQWPSLPDNQVQVRPSQRKFDSDHNVLEIIRRSTYIPSYLNRQAITLLSTLGIPDKVFIDLKDERVNELNKMFENESTAINVLLQNIDEYAISKGLADLVRAGFLQTRDRYLVNMISLFRITNLKYLKKKAKIRVAKGTFLLGVLDETGTLKEDEIYCCVSSDPNNPTQRKQITGTCVVWRNPCFHPGDVRVVTAVKECKPLRHLVDVIVFPSQGYRDIPNQCSGGDLDGDDFTLIYDERLIPEKTREPMNYQGQKPELVDQVEMHHIKRFFVNYVFSDHLGKIANAHLAKADYFEIGADHGQCIRLAQLHSDAVDFPKSGKPATFPMDLRAKMFPDFMENPDKPSYQSQKVLGVLYRSIEVEEFKLCTDSNFDDRLYVEGYEEYLENARMLKRSYDSDIKGLMNQFGILTEFEVTSGFIINVPTKVDKKKPREIERSVMEAFIPIKQHYQKEFEKEFYDEGTNIITPESHRQMEAKAYAWYYVTYHHSELECDPSESMITFPWTIHERLCEIAIKNNGKINRNSKSIVKTSIQQLTEKESIKNITGNYNNNSTVTHVSNNNAMIQISNSNTSNTAIYSNSSIINNAALIGNNYNTTTLKSNNYNTTLNGNNYIATLNSNNYNTANYNNSNNTTVSSNNYNATPSSNNYNAANYNNSNNTTLSSNNYNATLSSNGYNATLSSNGYNATFSSNGHNATLSSNGYNATLSSNGHNATLSSDNDDNDTVNYNTTHTYSMDPFEDISIDIERLKQSIKLGGI